MQLGMQNKLALHAPCSKTGRLYGMPAFFRSLAAGGRSAVHAPSNMSTRSVSSSTSSLRRARALPGRRGIRMAAQLAPATYAPPKAEAVILTLPGGKEVGYMP